MVKNKLLVYDPIKAIESSSGIYDGGVPKEVSLSTEEIFKLNQFVNNAANCKNCHEKNRSMGSGMLKIKGKNYVLKSVSSEKKELENQLKVLLGLIK